MKETIHTKFAPNPIGPYSQAVKVGEFLFISGQLAIDPEQGRLVISNIKDQTVRVIENIRAILEAADFSLSDIVQTNAYLSSLKLFKDFNDIYSKYFSNNFPARTTVEVKLLPGALVEISVIAHKRHQDKGNKL